MTADPVDDIVETRVEMRRAAIITALMILVGAMVAAVAYLATPPGGIDSAAVGTTTGGSSDSDPLDAAPVTTATPTPTPTPSATEPAGPSPEPAATATATAKPTAKPTAAPKPTAKPTPTPTTESDDADDTDTDTTSTDQITASTAEDSLGSFLRAASSAVLVADSEITDELTSVAAGAMLDEIEAQKMELEANGWSITGTPRLVSAVVTDATSDTATVTACIDSSDVATLDAQGTPIASSDDSPRRATNIYTLDHHDGTWRVVARTFPNNPDC
jgi:hypothetical protein